MKQLLNQTLNMLNNLNSDRISLVIYDPVTLTITIKQLGNVHIILSHLKGFIAPIKHTCILYPEDLKEIKGAIKYIQEEAGTVMIGPIKDGFRVWTIGDVAYTSKPRKLVDIKFHSISWRPLIWLERLKSEEVQMLFRTLYTRRVN